MASGGVSILGLLTPVLPNGHTFSFEECCWGTGLAPVFNSPFGGISSDAIRAGWAISHATVPQQVHPDADVVLMPLIIEGLRQQAAEFARLAAELSQR